MKILVIDNNTKHLTNIADSLKGHDVEIRKYHPNLDFECAEKDLIILSGGGGEGLEIHDEHQPGKLWYEDQMEFVRRCNKPIIGICMGFEIISRAFGARVEKLSQGLEGFLEFNTTHEGREHFSESQLKQFEAHDWGVARAPAEFKVLARSRTGVEIIKHDTRAIIATQFHPEKGGTLKLMQLVELLTRRLGSSLGQ
jgi:GMP synthase-like glutamine amidotransferase